MIRRDQFQLQIDRLSDTFGERHFPDQRTHMMWGSVEGIEYATVISIVDGFIRSSKYAPLPADFSQAVCDATKGSKIKYALGDIQPPALAQCLDCRDSGFVRLVRLPQFETWAKWDSGSTPCHCGRGRELINKAKARAKNPFTLGPQFGDHWRKSYSIAREPNV